MLRFIVTSYMPAWQPEEGSALLRDIFANIRLGSKLLGRAELESPRTLIPYNHANDMQVCFEMVLTGQAIEEIERTRSGGDLEFKMEIMGEIVDSQNINGVREDITFRINSTAWITALKQMEYGSYLLCELPFDIKLDEEFQVAVLILEKAKKHFYSGHYEDAVSACRGLLETIIPEREELKKIKEEAKNKARDQQTKAERLVLFLDSLKHLTSLAHHLDYNKNITAFSRDEAIMVLGTTAAAISSANTAKKNEALKDAA